MSEHDPGFIGEALKWILNAAFAIAIVVGGRSYSQSMKKTDDEKQRTQKQIDEQERRLRVLEKDSVTHDDLRRIESKIDEHNRQVTDRLDRILQRGAAK